jgi:hypothetical protein
MSNIFEQNYAILSNGLFITGSNNIKLTNNTFKNNGFLFKDNYQSIYSSLNNPYFVINKNTDH